MTRHLKLLISLLAAFGFCGPAPIGATETYTNPIIGDGADPWITYQAGHYYFTYTTGSSVQIHRATRLAGTNGISAAPVVSAFYPPPPFNKEVWAPELHFLRGKAYVYYATDDGLNANHRMFVAESDTTGPNFSFTFKGKIYDPATDRWAIDATVLEATNGLLYFIWTGWPGTQDGLQNLYIAPMSDPLTISGPRMLLATPNQTWESWIEEGPEVLQKDGRVGTRAGCHSPHCQQFGSARMRQQPLQGRDPAVFAELSCLGKARNESNATRWVWRQKLHTQLFLTLPRNLSFDTPHLRGRKPHRAKVIPLRLDFDQALFGRLP